MSFHRGVPDPRGCLVQGDAWSGGAWFGGGVPGPGGWPGLGGLVLGGLPLAGWLLLRAVRILLECILVYIAGFAYRFCFQFRLQTKWLHFTFDSYRPIHTAWSRIQIPILTAQYRSEIGIGIRNGILIYECK